MCSVSTDALRTGRHEQHPPQLFSQTSYKRHNVSTLTKRDETVEFRGIWRLAGCFRSSAVGAIEPLGLRWFHKPGRGRKGCRMETEPSLGQFVWLVRRELQWAHDVDQDQPLRFDVESVALDVVVDTERTSKGGGGLDLKVVGIGLSGSAGVENSSRRGSTVHVVFKARDIAGARWQVGAADLEPPPRRMATPEPAASGAPALTVTDSEPLPQEPSA
jgi:Trypsin-co-occurring domain 2